VPSRKAFAQSYCQFVDRLQVNFSSAHPVTCGGVSPPLQARNSQAAL
jgi:hypothetical protein